MNNVEINKSMHLSEHFSLGEVCPDRGQVHVRILNTGPAGFFISSELARGLISFILLKNKNNTAKTCEFQNYYLPLPPK